MTQWQPLVDRVKKLPGDKFTECRLALDSSFKPAPWKASWTRGVIDLLVVNGEEAAVIDYKTGKFKPSEQLHLYAGYVFSHYEQVQAVKTAFVWLKEKRFSRETIQRKDLPSVWVPLLERAKKLQSAYERNSWPARPSGLCRGWCPVTKCEFYKKRL
jgi:ATP-dependent exoDNAse (exonuclease V) beta subunit